MKIVPPEAPHMLWAVDAAQNQGERVAVVLHQYKDNLIPIMELAYSLCDSSMVSVVRTVNGLESILFHGGGQIDFRAPYVMGRGLCADLLIVDEKVWAEGREHVAPIIAASKSGRVLCMDSTAGRLEP